MLGLLLICFKTRLYDVFDIHLQRSEIVLERATFILQKQYFVKKSYREFIVAFAIAVF